MHSRNHSPVLQLLKNMQHSGMFLSASIVVIIMKWQWRPLRIAWNMCCGEDCNRKNLPCAVQK
jgi:hypothetical protein